MNDLQREYKIFIALVAGILIATLLSGSPTGYISILLLFLVFGIMVITRTWRGDRIFYIVCAGEPLVIACSIMNIWAGLFAVCMLAGMVSGELRLLESPKDIRFFALFCASSFLIALLIQVSNHVLLPLLIIGGIAAIVLGGQTLRMHQFRKHYSGA